jgi:Xaa-Pro dipeptidase
MCLHYCSCFSTYALQRVYLPSLVHSKYINVEVLQRYVHIDEVRMEDDLLITPKGYENLTTAPKGDAMREIVRKGNLTDLTSTSRGESLRAKTSNEQPTLTRAPGISTDKPESILKPIARAATMPAEFKQHRLVDFEPFEGLSLSSSSKHSQTTAERIQQWQRDHHLGITSRNRPHAQSQCASMCGNISRGVQHVYLTSECQCSVSPYGGSFEHPLPLCRECKILCEALDRLRQNLSLYEQGSPKPEAQPHFVAGTQKH